MAESFRPWRTRRLDLSAQSPSWMPIARPRAFGLKLDSPAADTRMEGCNSLQHTALPELVRRLYPGDAARASLVRCS